MRTTAATLLIAVLTTTVLAGCGLRPGDDETDLAPLSPEGAALAALGYDPEEVEPDGDPQRWERWRHRGELREHVLHGEIDVQTDDGPRTVLVQRGEITEIAGSTVTVVSTDGFAQTWTYGEALRVVESRTTIEPRELSTGAQVGVAGHDRAGTPIANLIVIPAR
jgi:PAS domain-containing protein